MLSFPHLELTADPNTEVYERKVVELRKYNYLEWPLLDWWLDQLNNYTEPTCIVAREDCQALTSPGPVRAAQAFHTCTTSHRCVQEK